MEAGFSPEGDAWWFAVPDGEEGTDFVLSKGNLDKLPKDNFVKLYPAYDLLWDLCIKYKEEVWGVGGHCGHYGEVCGEPILGFNRYESCPCSDSDCNKIVWYEGYISNTESVLDLLQQDKKEEAEQYIIQNSVLFNN
jgi:hypothetical protein